MPDYDPNASSDKPATQKPQLESTGGTTVKKPSGQHKMNYYTPVGTSNPYHNMGMRV